VAEPVAEPVADRLAATLASMSERELHAIRAALVAVGVAA
jgi:hypothetical protein